MGQGAAGDNIHPGGGNFHETFISYVARSFQQSPSFCYGHRLAHHFNIHIVQHNNIGTGCQGLLKLCQVGYFNFDAHGERSPFPDRFNGGSDASGGADMVFFN